MAYGALACGRADAAAPADRAVVARAQRQWTVEQGLPSNSLTALAEDADGLVWIATLAGLVRFDGVTFVVHDAARHANLGSDRFTTMKRTPDGALWLSTEQYDLYRFAGDAFTRVDDASVLSVAQSPEGWLAYGTTKGILVVGPDGPKLLPSAVTDARVLELDWPETGMLLALSDAELVEVAQPLAATARRTRSRPMPGPNSGALLQRRDGSVLVGTRAGLRQLDRDWSLPATTLVADEPVLALDSLDRADVMVGTSTRIGELSGTALTWMAPNRDSLGEEPLQLRIGDETWHVLADRIEHDGTDGVRAPSRIADALVDHEGNLWLATNASGLMQVHTSQALLLGRSEGLAGANVYPILAGADGTMWVGTLDGGLQRLRGEDPRDWTRVALPFGVVWSLHAARDGALWVGGDGVCVLRGEACSRDGLPAELQQQTPTRAIHEDPHGRMWVGTVWGLWRGDAGQWRMLPADQGTQPGRAARAFVDDGDARLWVAMNGDGVIELRNGARVRRIATEQGLGSNSVRALWRDGESGDLWAGTENRGLCRVRVAGASRVDCVGRAQGLPSSGMHAIMADAAGRFWINSNQGVYTLERAELDAVLDHGGTLTQVRVYDSRSGLRSSEGNGGVSPPAARDPAGRLWFPTQSGIAIFDPSLSTASAHAPVARVDAARVGSETIRAPTRIALAPPHRDLALLLTANSYQDAEHVRFRYRLGDQPWRDAGTRRELELTQLPPGEWTLALQARNAGAQWPDDSTLLQVSVLPMWHERWWVRALAGLLLVASVVAAFVVRGRVLRARQRELEAQVVARTGELAAALDTVRTQHEDLARLHRSRTEFAANISHELKTPLTLLTAPLADHPGIAAVVGADLFAAMRDSGQRMQRLLRQLADLHLIDSAAMRLRRSATSVNAFVVHCVLPFAALAEQRGLELVQRSSIDDGVAIDIDAFQFEKVLGNLLSNAIKFTPPPGRIDVTVSTNDARVVVQVEDSGPGVPAGHRRAIFERFYQVDGSMRRAHEGSGIGLALAREIVTLHGGHLEYTESALGGAGFRMSLPRSAEPVAPGNMEPTATAASLEDASHAIATTSIDERPCVLLVEDQSTLRTYLRQALSDRYEVLEAANGNEGLQVARATLPDVIVSDVMMPGMDGVEMTRVLRADVATRAIPLLFLTALDGEHERIAGLLAGGDHWLTKPFSAQVVRAHIDAQLRSRRWLVESLQPAAAPAGVAAKPTPPTLLARAEAIIRGHLDDEAFDLDALVRALATSRSQLHRKLQAEHGLSPGELITRTRLRAAAELLAAGRGSVTEVCYSVGFRSLSSFSRAFKLAFGCNPGEYADRARRAVPEPTT